MISFRLPARLIHNMEVELPGVGGGGVRYILRITTFDTKLYVLRFVNTQTAKNEVPAGIYLCAKHTQPLNTILSLSNEPGALDLTFYSNAIDVPSALWMKDISTDGVDMYMDVYFNGDIQWAPGDNPAQVGEVIL
jgi:hypothetical protein